jgi:hypothetical protein
VRVCVCVCEHQPLVHFDHLYDESEPSGYKQYVGKLSPTIMKISRP